MDLSFVGDELRFIGRLFLTLTSATVSGIIFGLEREIARKPAGLKTLVFVTVGSALFSFFSFEFSRVFGGDPTRIASNVATGIGFIGGGAIVRRGDIIEGLTTASIIWVCGAIGIAVGAGYHLAAFLISAGGLVFLLIAENAERRFFRRT